MEDAGFAMEEDIVDDDYAYESDDGDDVFESKDDYDDDDDMCDDLAPAYDEETALRRAIALSALEAVENLTPRLSMSSAPDDDDRSGATEPVTPRSEYTADEAPLAEALRLLEDLKTVDSLPKAMSTRRPTGPEPRCCFLR
mmetsp:Transcript_3277/g.8415  ORF Transcript_3277/g.8415 Transcript_3277/m.8415 type:complete len:141 (-) Transcript_3277:70-492(-)